MAEFKYVDHLTEYVKEKVATLVRDHGDSLPKELTGLLDERIIALITEMATPILRKIEDDAIVAGIERAASLIRYSKNKSKGG